MNLKKHSKCHIFCKAIEYIECFIVSDCIEYIFSRLFCIKLQSKFSTVWIWTSELFLLKINSSILIFILFFQMTPCNTPATPPNFPDTLIAFSRMTTSSENSKLGSSPSEYTNVLKYLTLCDKNVNCIYAFI